MSLLIPILIIAGGFIGYGLAGPVGAGVGILIGTVAGALLDFWITPRPRRPWH